MTVSAQQPLGMNYKMPCSLNYQFKISGANENSNQASTLVLNVLSRLMNG